MIFMRIKLMIWTRKTQQKQIKIFIKKIAKNIVEKTIFVKNNFKKNLTKNIFQKILMPNVFPKKKVGAKPPCCPQGLG